MAVALCLLVLIPATAATGYYVLLTVFGRSAAQRAVVTSTPRHSMIVLIPAHDEEDGLPRTIRSIRAADYPSHLVRIVVVADNCVDRTAIVGNEHGAEVVERHDPTRRGKGYALAHGLARLPTPPPDAVFVLDSDCEITPGLLRQFDRLLSAGADAVQARLVSRNADCGAAGLLAAVGAEIDHAVAVGRERLGWGVPLRGTGMLFRRAVLERLPWTATGSTEDAEYAAQLSGGGVRVRLAADECVLCDAPPTTETLCDQRRRWRSALRVRDGLIGRLFTSKPLILLQLAAAVVTVVACEPFIPALYDWAFGTWLAVVCVGSGWVYARAVRRVGLTGRRWRSLLWAPVLVVRLGWIALEGLWKRDQTWRRSARPVSGSSPAPTV